MQSLYILMNLDSHVEQNAEVHPNHVRAIRNRTATDILWCHTLKLNKKQDAVDLLFNMIPLTHTDLIILSDYLKLFLLLHVVHATLINVESDQISVTFY